MRIVIPFAAFILMGVSNTVWSQSTEMHGGHGAGSGGGENGCIKAKITRYSPEHLSEVKPGAAFSFAVSGSNGPGHIHVSIKDKPVEVSVEDKETFFAVKGHLPSDISNSIVRISVKAKAKIGKCDADGGWLLKVGQ